MKKNKSEESTPNTRKKKRIWIYIALAVALAIASVAFVLSKPGEEVTVFKKKLPEVMLESINAGSEDKEREIKLSLYLTCLKEDEYPAASFSISFDPSKLEFTGLKEGNVPIKSEESASGVNLPDWAVNVERANKTGVINIMYLDMTGGKHVFKNDYLEAESVLFDLGFRLRGSVRSGDVYEVSIDDAIFAANDEAKSLSESTGTLKTTNGRIVVGD